MGRSGLAAERSERYHSDSLVAKLGGVPGIDTGQRTWPGPGPRASARPMTGTREPELATLRKLADDLAKNRNERVTTGHLLAAIASQTGAAADLLKERRLDAE